MLFQSAIWNIHHLLNTYCPVTTLQSEISEIWLWARRHIYTVATTRQLTGHASCIQCLAPAKCSVKTRHNGWRMCWSISSPPQTKIYTSSSPKNGKLPEKEIWFSTKGAPLRPQKHLTFNPGYSPTSAKTSVFQLRALPYDYKPHCQPLPESLIFTKMTDTPPAKVSTKSDSSNTNLTEYLHCRDTMR